MGRKEKGRKGTKGKKGEESGKGKEKKERRVKYKALKDWFLAQEQNMTSEKISIIFAELQFLWFLLSSPSTSPLHAGAIIGSGW